MNKNIQLNFDLLRKIILSILGIALIFISVFFAKKIIANKKKPRSVSTKVVKSVLLDTVKNKTVPVVISANGNLQAKQRVELYSEVQGIFKSGNKLFRAGQVYTKGQALIRIDASEYSANVQSAKSNLYNSISSVMPDLLLDYPEVYPQWQEYLKGFNVSKSVVALPAMDSDRVKYFITGKGIVSNYYDVKNLEERLVKYQIRAPYTGILTKALVTEGSLIRSGQKLGEFINPSSYELEVAVSKSFIDLLKVGEKVDLTNLDKTEKYNGKVIRVNGSIDATTQTIAVFIEVKGSTLKEGDYLEANLDARKIVGAIEIDRNLLIDNEKIFVVKDSILAFMPAHPVYFSEAKVILKNVVDGTIMLKKPVPGAYPGMLVKPLEETNSSN